MNNRFMNIKGVNQNNEIVALGKYKDDEIRLRKNFLKSYE